MYEVEVKECIIYTSGVFLVLAETDQEISFCNEHGMHMASEHEIDVCMKYEEQLNYIN